MVIDNKYFHNSFSERSKVPKIVTEQ
jgi:hypothetical protein